MGDHHTRLTTNRHHDAAVAEQHDRQDDNAVSKEVPNAVDDFSRRTAPNDSGEAEAVNHGGGGEHQRHVVGDGEYPGKHCSGVPYPLAQQILAPGLRCTLLFYLFFRVDGACQHQT